MAHLSIPRLALVMALFSVFGLRPSARGAEPEQPDAAAVAKLDAQRSPKPGEFAIVFSFGYGGDTLPKDDADYDTLLSKIKEAGFNVIQSSYTPKRLELCEKHGIRMMVDLQADGHHHVYKSPDLAKAVCEKLRGNKTVWGYSIWNDPIRKTYNGRKRDINNVRTWDPTHPAYCGTYRTDGMRHITNADVLGYYDFHWSRGREQLFGHLMTYRQWAIERDAVFYRWAEVDAGQAGKGNYNRCLHTVNTSIACGLKGVLWFLATSMMNQKTLEWTTIGKDIAKVNAQIAPMRKVIGELGNPSAVYSTRITRTLNDDPLPEGKTSMMPPGLESAAFPADFWIQPARGEFVMGVFKDKTKRPVMFLANHNAYQAQEVQLKITRAGKVSIFNRTTGDFAAIAPADGVLALKLEPAGGQMLRFED